MIYIDKSLSHNEFVLNINNNVRNPFPGQFDVKTVRFTFVHSLSQRTSYENANVWSEDYNIPGLPVAIWGTYNDRFTEFYAENQYLSQLRYDGQYDVTIKNEDGVEIYKGIWMVKGNSELEENPFVEYTSDNDNNISFIYIE